MSRDSFIYVTYIRSTPQNVWDALLQPEFTRQYWFGVTLESTWQQGAPWRMVHPDGRTTDIGSIIEIDPPKKMVIRWRHELDPELTAEGWSRCTIELEPNDDLVKLTVLHELANPRADSKLINAVSGGWPRILSSLKSLLETGAPLEMPSTKARYAPRR